MQKIKNTSRGGALLWIVVFSAVILAIIVIAGVIALGRKEAAPTPTPTPSPTQTSTPTPTTLPLPPGLSIYRNQDPPFEFFYPEELRVSKDVRKSGTTISLKEKTPSSDSPFVPHFTVAFEPNLDGVDTAEYIESKTRWKASADARMIGGYEAVALYLPETDAPARWVFAIDKDAGFGLWLFSITPALSISPDLPSNADEIILSSFRFTEIQDGIVQGGIIEGSLSFPSQFMPRMRVCAETINAAERKEYCITTPQTNVFTYSIEVPPGSYYVFATTVDYADLGKAYYSELVTCGLSIDCPSHKPIAVRVESGQTVKNIDPVDWYK